MILKRLAYLITKFKHDCAEVLTTNPQRIWVSNKVFVRCPICRKEYPIQFAGMIRKLIQKELKTPEKGKKK